MLPVLWNLSKGASWASTQRQVQKQRGREVT
ncbi:hypothetical protein R3I94_008778 [Phoxinus phoxinus]